MTPPVDLLPEPDSLALRSGTTSQLAAASEAGISASTAVAPPLRVVPALDLAPSRGHQPFPAVAWLLDGAGWPWLRATADLTALLAVITAVAAGHPRAGVSLLPLAPLALAMFWLGGKYRRGISAHLLRETLSAATLLASATVLLAIWHAYVAGPAVSQSLALRACIFGFAAVAVVQGGLLGARYLARALGVAGRPTLIIGAGQVGLRVALRLDSRRTYGLRPIGFLDFASSSDGVRSPYPELPWLGSPDDLSLIARTTGAKHVVISFARERDRQLLDLIRRCNALGLEVSLIPRLFESINHRLSRDSVGPLPLHIMQPTNPRSWEFACKHVIDRTLAALGLLVLAPVLAGVAAAVKLTSPGPVLFRQRRVGRDGRYFEMLKFRSMRVEEPPPWDGPGFGLAPGGIEGSDRRTPIGRFLRRSSIDELPQLWNVFRGDMSLVGPRPERPEYVEQFRDEVARYDDRHRVKSGITGAAQVNGLRGNTGLADRIEWDNYYIENWSLILDLKILFHTVLAVLRPVE